MAKERLDVLLVSRGLAESREKAKAIIMSGNVYVDGQKEDKAGSNFPAEAVIEVRGNTLKYVSRGGLKLEKAMKNFDITLQDKVCMDIGASTSVLPRADLRTVCYRTVQSKSMRLMWDTDSLHGNCAMMNVWSAWKRQISAM